MGCLRVTLLLGVCLVAFGVSPFTPPAAADAPPCFAATGACIEGVFAAYWQAYGGLAVNGYPLGPAGLERLGDTRAYLVQYFERVRLEYHPENVPPYDILLGQFGRQMHPADPAVAPRADAAFFPETGHNVRAGFRAYWDANGGLAQFGLPLTESSPKPSRTVDPIPCSTSSERASSTTRRMPRPTTCCSVSLGGRTSRRRSWPPPRASRPTVGSSISPIPPVTASAMRTSGAG